MTLNIRRADFDDPALRVFLEDHLADLSPHSPSESQHALDLSALQQPTVQLWVAWKAQRIAGTCALAALTPEHEELKSMRTAPEFRNQGIASELLKHALTNAQSRGVQRVSLETGSMGFFASARALYTKHGFEPCQPFGSYVDDVHSCFMTRTLRPAPASH